MNPLYPLVSGAQTIKILPSTLEPGPQKFPPSHMTSGQYLAIGLDLETRKPPTLEGKPLLSPILFS